MISQIVSALLCFWQLLRTKESYGLKIRKIRFDKGILVRSSRSDCLPECRTLSLRLQRNRAVQYQCIRRDGNGGLWGLHKGGRVRFSAHQQLYYALTTFVGQNLGAKQEERTRKGARFGILAAVILAELIGVVVFLLAPQLIAAFDSSPEIIRFGVEKARTAALFYCLLAFSHSIAAILRGAGKTMVSMIIMMMCWCVIRVSFLSVMIPLTHSIQAVYWVYPLTWSLSSIAFFLYYRKVNWMHAFEAA